MKNESKEREFESIPSIRLDQERGEKKKENEDEDEDEEKRRTKMKDVQRGRKEEKKSFQISVDLKYGD